MDRWVVPCFPVAGVVGGSGGHEGAAHQHRQVGAWGCTCRCAGSVYWGGGEVRPGRAAPALKHSHLTWWQPGSLIILPPCSVVSAPQLLPLQVVQQVCDAAHGGSAAEVGHRPHSGGAAPARGGACQAPIAADGWLSVLWCADWRGGGWSVAIALQQCCHALKCACSPALRALRCSALQPFPAMSQLKSLGSDAGGEDGGGGGGEGGSGASAAPQRQHIMLLGRFFRGRQSKVRSAALCCAALV